MSPRRQRISSPSRCLSSRFGSDRSVCSDALLPNGPDDARLTQRSLLDLPEHHPRDRGERHPRAFGLRRFVDRSARAWASRIYGYRCVFRGDRNDEARPAVPRRDPRVGGYAGRRRLRDRPADAPPDGRLSGHLHAGIRRDLAPSAPQLGICRRCAGLSGIPERGDVYLLYGVLIVLIIAFFFVGRSHIGRAMEAMREDETAAGVMGVNVPRYKLATLVVSAMLAGLAGCLSAHL